MCKMPEIGISRNCFPKGKPIDRAHEFVDCAGPVTVDRWPLPRSGAHRSSASGRSGARELRPRSGGLKRWAGEFNDGVAAAREAVERRLTGGRDSAQKSDGEGTLRAKRRSVGGVGVFTKGGVKARRGRPSTFNGWR
jgi:hypothetical protein